MVAFAWQTAKNNTDNWYNNNLMANYSAVVQILQGRIRPDLPVGFALVAQPSRLRVAAASRRHQCFGSPDRSLSDE